MKVLTVNGDETTLLDGATVASLLEQLELKPGQVAVEVNFELVPREQHRRHVLCAGDRVEVVTLAGGG